MNWAIRDCGRASPGGRTKVAVEELVVEVVEVRLVVELRDPREAVPGQGGVTAVCFGC